MCGSRQQWSATGSPTGAIPKETRAKTDNMVLRGQSIDRKLIIFLLIEAATSVGADHHHALPTLH
jgi:hypothetical protein